MIIGMISDIHIDINKDYPVLESLQDMIHKKNIDILLIAGDISESSDKTLAFIEALNNSTQAKVYFVPGNHDMWDKYDGKTQIETQKVYKKYQASEFCLSEKSVELPNGWVIIGNIGWFDYSFGEGYSQKEYDAMTNNGRTWQDKLNSSWCEDNIATHNWQLSTLKKELSLYPARHKILVTHMLSNPHFCVPKDWSTTIDWAYFNAFLGSNDYFELCKANHIDYALMGHVHFRGVTSASSTTYVCSCLNYHSEWQSQDYKSELEASLYIIEV